MALQTSQSKLRKTLLKKHCKIKIDERYIRGEVSIIGYRKYSCREEIDIEFRGEISARVGYISDDKWFSLEEMEKVKTQISKIKLTRFLKRRLFYPVSNKLAYFSINLHVSTDIKKVKWVG
jgi:hypothetical protein